MKIKSPKISSLYQILSLFFVIAIMFLSCKKDDDIKLDLPVDVNGFWIATETTTGNCHGSVETETKTEVFLIKQNNDAITVTVYPIAAELEGKMEGSKITWSGTLPTNSGNTTIDFTGTVSNNGNNTSGSASWDWSSSTFKCSGTTQIVANKVVQETANFAGDWQGTWQSEEASYNGSFSVSVTQNDTLLSGTITVPEIGMTNAGLKGFVSGNIVYFGDIDDKIKFVGVLNNNSGTGTYAYPAYYDEGSWTATKQ